KGFDPFMTRRGLAQSKDTLVTAQQMNKLHAVTPWMQWSYAFHTIPARKRYDKWSKKGPIDPDVKLLSEYFYISMEKASEYVRFLPKEVLAEIREKMGRTELNAKAKPRKAK
ncbi:DNA polymerase clamp loader subunit A, partial [Escherichia coli]